MPHYKSVYYYRQSIPGVSLDIPRTYLGEPKDGDLFTWNENPEKIENLSFALAEGVFHSADSR